MHVHVKTNICECVGAHTAYVIEMIESSIYTWW